MKMKNIFALIIATASLLMLSCGSDETGEQKRSEPTTKPLLSIEEQGAVDLDVVHMLIERNDSNWNRLAEAGAACVISATSRWLHFDRQSGNRSNEIYSTFHSKQKTRFCGERRYYDVALVEKVKDRRERASVVIIYDGTRILSKLPTEGYFRVSASQTPGKIDLPGMPNVLVDPLEILHAPYYGRSLSKCLQRYLQPGKQEIVSVLSKGEAIKVRVHQAFQPEQKYPESGLLSEIEFSRQQGLLPVRVRGMWLHSNTVFRTMEFSYKALDSIWVPTKVETKRFFHKNGRKLVRLHFVAHFRNWEVGGSFGDPDKYSMAEFKRLFPNVNRQWDFSGNTPALGKIE